MLRLTRSHNNILKQVKIILGSSYLTHTCFSYWAQSIHSCGSKYASAQEALVSLEVSRENDSMFSEDSDRGYPSHTFFPAADEAGLTFDFGKYEDSTQDSEVESPRYRTLRENVEQFLREGEYLGIVKAFENHADICLSLSSTQSVNIGDPRLIRIVFQAYLKIDAPARLWKTCEPLSRLGLKIDPRTLTLVVVSCLKNREWNCIIAINEARGKELGPLCKVIHAVALAHNKAIFDSLQAFRSIFSDKLQRPTKIGYTLYITELIKLQRLNETLIVYEAFIKDGHVPLVDLANKVLGLLLFENRHQQAHLFYQKTFEQSRLTPNPLTLVLLVNGFVNKSRPDLARVYLEKMLSLGFTDATHVGLIWERLFHTTLATAHQDKWELTVDLLGYMRDHFPIPNKSHLLASHLFIAHAVAPGKLGASHSVSGEALLSLLESIGTIPELPRTSQTYLLIVQHLCQVGALHLLPVLIDRMAVQEGTVPAHVYGVALNRCFAENNLEVADKIYISLLSLNIDMSRPLYSSIISGLYRVSRSKEAYKLYRTMREAGHSPILGLAIKLFGLSHKLGDQEFKGWLIDDTINAHSPNGSLTKEEIYEFKKVIQSRGCLPKKN